MTTWNNIFFLTPSTYLMEVIFSMHDYVLMFLLSILIMVMMNLLYTYFFKNFNLNFYENHQIEMIWTVLPFILLVFIAAPSLFSLYMLDTCLYCGMTVSILGHQWYWSYFYKDLFEMNHDSYMLPSNSSKIRLLDTDNRLILPSFVPLRFLISSSDVLHSWALPSCGVKMDAIPGRVNQFCFSMKRSGVFFGQCSEICGANHSFMPIVIESVPLKFFSELKLF